MLEGGEGIEGGDVVELSLNSVAGLSALKTMKVIGSISGHLVVVLIDCGATYNFIATELAKQVRLPTTATTGYGITIGTSKSVKGESICKGVVLSLPRIEVIDGLLPF